MAEGQRLGKKDKYTYTMDDGTVIKLKLDKTLGDIAGNGLSPTTTADNAINKPLNFKPRGVHWQFVNTDGSLSRKFIVCAVDSTLYTSPIEQNVTIDGDAGQTTGRRGEQISF